MMRNNKAVSSMQKTYDDCYLICSTAIFFEGQNNEPEALRSWRSALDKIYYHNAYRMPQDYRPRTETDRELLESLRKMELTCKERIGVLEALRDSRAEAEKEGVSTPSTGSFASPNGMTAPEPGWLGNGTIPPIDYSDLARPSLPSRPAPPPRPSFDSQGPSARGLDAPPLDTNRPLSPNPPPSTRKSRSPSPEKKGRMKKTLREGRAPKKVSAPTPASKRPPAASKAADLAWYPKPRQQSPTMAGHVSDPSRRSPIPNGREPRADSDDAGRASSDYSRQDPPRNHLSPSLESIARPRPPEHVIPPYLTSMQPEPSKTRPPPRGVSVESSSSISALGKLPPDLLPYRKEYSKPTPISKARIAAAVNAPRTPGAASAPEDEGSSPRQADPALSRRPLAKVLPKASPRRAGKGVATPSESTDETSGLDGDSGAAMRKGGRKKRANRRDEATPESSGQEDEGSLDSDNWQERLAYVKKHLPRGVDPHAAKQIFNEIVVQGDEVHWSDVAGLEAAKKALKEAVVYPFLRPDLFMGLREPARGMLLFGPPGTGKTMLARAVATESRATFFAISASSLTSKWLGDSEKLVRALFGLARALAPSIIFVDEIDSLLSSRGGSSEHESTRRIKTEFLIQWSDLQRAAAGKEVSEKGKEGGDPSRVLVLAATNMPWAIDDAARRRFVRRQYIPLPERPVRMEQLRKLMSHQKHDLTGEDFEVLVRLTDGYSGSDITALAKDAAMGPLRSLGERLLSMARDEIRPISFDDFEASLVNIRPSVNQAGLQEFEDWARDFGERGM